MFTEKSIQAIRIGGNLTIPPLPHHHAYGSVRGGSMDLSYLAGQQEARPSLARDAFGKAMDNAGLMLILHGPWELPAVCAARSFPTPRRRNAFYRVRPLFHCRHTTARIRRLIHLSTSPNTPGVSQ